jgi:hypothetical protein
MRSDLVIALVVGVLLILLIILSRRLCRSGKGDIRSHQTAKSHPRPQAGDEDDTCKILANRVRSIP